MSRIYSLQHAADFVRGKQFLFYLQATPRLARLVLSGGIVFTVYEAVIKALGGDNL